MVVSRGIGVNVHNSIQTECNGRIAGHEYHRRLIIVPERNKLNQKYRHEGVSDKRHCNLEENLEVVCAVNLRRFGEGHGQRLANVVEHEEI